MLRFHREEMRGQKAGPPVWRSARAIIRQERSWRQYTCAQRGARHSGQAGGGRPIVQSKNKGM
jgi:hypothetical protein